MATTTSVYEDEVTKKRQWRNVPGATIKPTSFSYDAINRDIDRLRNVNTNAPNINYDYNRGVQNIYQLTDLQDTLNRLNTPQQMQYQNPEQLTQFMDTWLGAMQPYLQSSQQVAQTQLNQDLQALQNQWARRGLLGTTAAAKTEQDLASNYALQAQNQLNAAMMEALARSLDFANLGLAERQLGLQQDQAVFDALLSALALQEQMNQNIRNINRAMSQDEFNNWADALGLTLQQRQAVIDSMLRGADLESTNLQRTFQNHLANALQEYQAGQDYINNLYQAAQLAESQRQFDQGLREKQRQFNFDNAYNWSRLFGQFVTPVEGGSGLAAQLQGLPTLDATQFQQQLAYQYAQLRQQAEQAAAARALQERLAQQRQAMTPLEQLQLLMGLQQYNQAAQNPDTRYGTGYTTFLYELQTNPPTTPEDYEAWQRRLNAMATMWTTEGKQAAQQALEIYNPAANQKESWFERMMQQLRKQLRSGGADNTAPSGVAEAVANLKSRVI